MSRIAIIGAGAWGTGLTIVLGRNRTHHVPHNVRLRPSTIASPVPQAPAPMMAMRLIGELLLTCLTFATLILIRILTQILTRSPPLFLTLIPFRRRDGRCFDDVSR